MQFLKTRSFGTVFLISLDYRIIQVHLRVMKLKKELAVNLLLRIYTRLIAATG
jgi:hypothetical protein